MIQHAWRKCEGRVEETAAMLGLSRKGLYLKRQRYQLKRPARFAFRPKAGAARQGLDGYGLRYTGFRPRGAKVRGRIWAQTRRQFVFQSAATLAAAGFVPARAWAAETPVEAETAFGRIRGVDVDGIKTFKAIPYGASTAGRNRFMPPVDPAKWTGVRDALAYGPSAPQRQPGTAPQHLGSRPWPAPACARKAKTAWS